MKRKLLSLVLCWCAICTYWCATRKEVTLYWVDTSKERRYKERCADFPEQGICLNQLQSVYAITGRGL